MPRLPVKQYLDPSQIGSVPEQWSPSWFRRFLTHYFTPLRAKLPLRTSFGNNTNASAWMHLGTLRLNSGSSATFVWHVGAGYNSASNQQAIATMVVRAGNGGAAPNLSGISVIQHGATQPVLAARAVAINSVTAAANTVWDLYVQCAAYTVGPIEAVINTDYDDAFTFNIYAATPGTPASAYVNANVGSYLDPSQGSGLDGVLDGSTYLRFPAAHLNGSRQVTIDNGVADGSNYARMPSPPPVSASGSTSLSQNGTTTTINVGAATFYLGNIVVNTNSGSVNPGAYGTYHVYFDNPGYGGGAVTYQATTNVLDLTKNPFRFSLGSITTSSGGGGSGGGTSGGCFSGDTRVLTPDGFKRFDELPERFEIVNRTGRHFAQLLKHYNSLEPMRRMGGNLVTEGHLMRVGGNWVRAADLFHEKAILAPRTVYNMHVVSADARDHHYVLENGLVAHNIKN